MITFNMTLILLALASILYASLLAALVGRYLRRRGLRHWADVLLLAYVLLSFLWTLGQLVLQLEPLLDYSGLLPRDLLAGLLWYALIPLALLFLGVTCQFLTRRFVRRGPKMRSGLGWSWWLLGLVWLALVVLLSEDWSALLAAPGESLEFTLNLVEGWWGVQRVWLAFLVLVVGWACAMVAAMVLTIRAYRHTQQPLHRSQIAYWGLTTSLTLVGGLLFLIGRGGWGSLLHLLGSASGTYLLLTHRLPHMRRLLRRMLGYLVITLLMTSFYAAAFLLGYYALQAVPGYPPAVVAASLTLLLVAIVHPLLDWVRAVVAGTASRGGRDASRIVAEYSILIGNLLELEDLAVVALGLVREALEIRSGTLFVMEQKGASHTRGTDQNGRGSTVPRDGIVYHLRGVAGVGKDQPGLRLSSESPLAEYLSHEQRPLTQQDLDLQRRFRAIPAQERQWLSDQDMDVYVPICTEGEWIGLLALGPKMSGEPYFDDDLDLLLALSNQTAVALQNVRLFDELNARNAECERTNRELAAANQVLVRLDRDKTSLLRAISHEVFRPQDAIVGYVDLLRELSRTGSLTAERGEELVQGIASAVQRLKEIAANLSEVTRVESETINLQLGPVSIASTVQAAADHWVQALQERKLTFSTLGLEDLPRIKADSGRLQQVFVELIHNAIRFTPDGGQLRVRGSRRDDEPSGSGEWVELVMTDTGLGIAAGNLERVFDPFYRSGNVILHDAGRTEFGTAGPGLGLYVVREIVKAHGGRVWATSSGYDVETCPGTEIHILLPLAR
jgi:signal transduction histidine kinase